MNVSLHRSSCISSIAAVIVTASALTLAGCSFDAAPVAASVDKSAAISGIIHGGPNPVTGATVTLYATTSNGYGAAGNLLATATTNSSGSFSFNPSSYTCPAGQQAYIVSAGGNTGGNVTNPNAVLMAAIGPCSSLSSSTYIWIDEPSTVAAAYALGNFMTITGTGASTVVNVSAPANNNAVSGSCTGTGSAMSCKAAGLAHAFLNAANLVNAVGTASTPPTGTVYASPALNATTTSTAVALQNLIPQQEINSLADSVESCVNSAGLTGTGDTTSTCGQLFTAATVSNTYTSSATYTTKPINTLQALVNLAKFPFTGTSAIYGLANGNAYYQPTLTAAPPDWSIAIIYRSVSNGTLPVGASYYTSTDINDNVYSSSLTVPSTGSSAGAAPLFIQSLSSNGVGNWTTAAQITTSTSFICSQTGTTTAATQTPCLSATDTLGNLWFGNGSVQYSGGGLYQVSTSTGVVTPFTTAFSGTTYYPFALAVDANNDLFYTSAEPSGDNLWKMPSGSTSSTVPTPVTTGGVIYAGAHISDSIAFDTLGDIFAPLASGSNVGFLYVQNTGTLSAEAFGTTANQCNCLGTTGGADPMPTGGMVDASGNFWMTNAANLVRVVGSNAQAVTGGGSAGLTTIPITGASAMRISSMDGAGTIFSPDGVTPSPPVLRIYYSALTTPAQASLASCNTGGASGNTACIAATFGAPNGGVFYKSNNAAPDSTGSLWVSSYGNDGVIQILGVAAPTWPQASYLHPAVMPQ